MTKKVFISHANKDKEAAKELVTKLSEKGVQAWFDQFELRPGDSWENQIKTAMVESDAVVVLLGDGDTSPNVLVEAGMAFGQGKMIFPVIVGENANVGVFSNLQQVRAYGENGIESAADKIAVVMNEAKNILKSV